MCLWSKESTSPLEGATLFLIENGVDEEKAGTLLVTLYLTLFGGVDSDSVETARLCLVQSGVSNEKADSVLEYLYPVFDL